MNTKEKILEASLNLFSKKGYDGVGIDEIATEVGIKGPSIYRYFKSKDEILNSVIEMVDQEYITNVEHYSSNKEFNITSLDEFKKNSMKYIDYTLHNERIIKARKLIVIEQFRNKKISDIATKHFITLPSKIYEDIFTCLINQNLIVNDNHKNLAFEFATPISMLIQTCDREPEQEKDIITMIINHIDYFIKIHKVKKQGE